MGLPQIIKISSFENKTESKIPIISLCFLIFLPFKLISFDFSYFTLISVVISFFIKVPLVKKKEESLLINSASVTFLKGLKYVK